MNRKQRRNPTKQELAKNINDTARQTMMQSMQISKKVASLEEGVDFMTDAVIGTRLSTGDQTQLGDNVIIGYVGRIDGKPFEGGMAESMTLRDLGSGKLIPGFEDYLVCIKPESTVTFKVTFPENYGSKNLAGKEAEFTVVLIAAYRPSEALKTAQDLVANARKELSQKTESVQ